MTRADASEAPSEPSPSEQLPQHGPPQRCPPRDRRAGLQLGRWERQGGRRAGLLRLRHAQGGLRLWEEARAAPGLVRGALLRAGPEFRRLPRGLRRVRRPESRRRHLTRGRRLRRARRRRRRRGRVAARSAPGGLRPRGVARVQDRRAARRHALRRRARPAHERAQRPPRRGLPRRGAQGLGRRRARRRLEARQGQRRQPLRRGRGRRRRAGPADRRGAVHARALPEPARGPRGLVRLRVHDPVRERDLDAAGLRPLRRGRVLHGQPQRHAPRRHARRLVPALHGRPRGPLQRLRPARVLLVLREAERRRRVRVPHAERRRD